MLNVQLQKTSNCKCYRRSCGTSNYDRTRLASIGATIIAIVIKTVEGCSMFCSALPIREPGST